MSSRLSNVSFSSLLSGPTVTVVWGVGQRRAVVPGALLRSCRSPSLNTLLKQVWLESQDGIIDWKEQDGPTIERFLTWLYRGDYNAPNPQPHSPAGPPGLNSEGKGDQENGIYDTAAEDILDPEPIPEPDHDILPETGQERGQHPNEWPPEGSCAIQNVIAASCDGRPLTPINSCLAVGLPEEHQTSEAGIFAQGPFPYDSHHYKDVLLAHAHLYTFALYHQITGLQDLSLQRLTQVLTRIDSGQPHAASEIAALVRHVYPNTLPPSYSRDAARKLVSQFAAMNFGELVHGDLETVLEEGGDFVLDVCRKVSRHERSAKNRALLAETHLRELEMEIQELKKEARNSKKNTKEKLYW